MPSIFSLTAAAVLLTAVVASPVEKRGSFTIQQFQSAKKVPRVGPLAMSRTYAKYGAKAPSDVQAAAAAASGSVTATPEDQYDSLYLCPVKVGSQTLDLDFDTGSADLWVFSTELPATQQSGHAVYQPTASKKKQGYTWNISYGDGSGASGDVYADTVVVGGVTATSQAVEAATSVSSSFSSDTNDDGLLGLAFSTINTVSPQKQTTFFDTVKSQLATPLFAVTLKYHQAGTYDFGYLDTAKYTGAISYVTVNTQNGFWEFTAGGYTVGSAAPVASSFDAIADTGTTLLYLPSAIVSAYYAKVAGAAYSSTYGGYVFACSAALPDFSLTIGGTSHRVPGKYINYAPASGSTCFGGIQRNTGIGFSILGDIFLKSQYVVHDVSQAAPRIGFATQANLA
ncbi:Asp-domain-containing protein [Pseudovirgaria hyperparasitica]|uniref:Asp-domain-containing protein n=1 Tax=Pseudovirgaria hyperparasitica TaxID=470096 RepID=A0A6A6W4U7_9PEZI|nr:Asp-domain-containing protein [Pseudovirgaria hyperparasitica]KAF2756950.1 Asp-domain-containing protein [Pseudovirgaria hyperparasitica]